MQQDIKQEPEKFSEAKLMAELDELLEGDDRRESFQSKVYPEEPRASIDPGYSTDSRIDKLEQTVGYLEANFLNIDSYLRNIADPCIRGVEVNAKIFRDAFFGLSQRVSSLEKHKGKVPGEEESRKEDHQKSRFANLDPSQDDIQIADLRGQFRELREQVEELKEQVKELRQERSLIYYQNMDLRTIVANLSEEIARLKKDQGKFFNKPASAQEDQSSEGQADGGGKEVFSVEGIGKAFGGILSSNTFNLPPSAPSSLPHLSKAKSLNPLEDGTTVIL